MGTRAYQVCLLALAISLGGVTLGGAAPPGLTPTAPTVAVHNAAGDAGEGLVGVVTEALHTRAEAMPQLRGAAASPWELEGRIVTASAQGDRAQVRLAAELRPPAGALRRQAEVTGEARSLGEAAAAAAEQAMEDLGVCLQAKGTLYFYSDNRLEALVTIGSTQGLRPGARVAFLRRGEMVGQGEVTTVRDADAIVRMDADVAAGSVLVGDDARVLRNGPRSAVDAVIARRESQSRAGTILAYALLGGLIIAAR